MFWLVFDALPILKGPISCFSILLEFSSPPTFHSRLFITDLANFSCSFCSDFFNLCFHVFLCALFWFILWLMFPRFVVPSTLFKSIPYRIEFPFINCLVLIIEVHQLPINIIRLPLYTSFTRVKLYRQRTCTEILTYRDRADI